MSITRISQELRRLVIQRADGVCEYCLIHEDDTFFGCEIDHIISEKHGGPTTAENLAYACVYCNRLKGSDIGSLIPGTQQLVRLFNPRADSWANHFLLAADGIRITSMSAIGEATVRILGFNQPERLMERHTLQAIGRYPSIQAIKHIQV